MLRSNKDKQTAYEFVSIEQLVPQDHMLRKIDKYIDFSFILDKVRPYYCEDNGRPAIDPLILFKMIFLVVSLLPFEGDTECYRASTHDRSGTEYEKDRPLPCEARLRAKE
ncbi:hypothetical protein BRE01_57430 [Brevibacillus reuszeri]|uniref:Transposase InsH N-terminal domain-containing protein n=1 Tax=Brevibacillus reuszeri TaxID=54915 RepID=A0ABQ0TW29_9BACL|nr:hypothetical protein BRE01_57430 [Brevibacillus reuszeri]